MEKVIRCQLLRIDAFSDNGIDSQERISFFLDENGTLPSHQCDVNEQVN